MMKKKQEIEKIELLPNGELINNNYIKDANKEENQNTLLSIKNVNAEI